MSSNTSTMEPSGLHHAAAWIPPVSRISICRSGSSRAADSIAEGDMSAASVLRAIFWGLQIHASSASSV
jgi:hypothetical protein